jgi:hypothetical protein
MTDGSKNQMMKRGRKEEVRKCIWHARSRQKRLKVKVRW